MSPTALSLGQIKLKRRRRYGDGSGGDGAHDPPTRILRRLRHAGTQRNCIKTHKNVISNVHFITID